ncbi:MAG: flagellar biosynthetic protein FliP [Bdellovibrionales bacterium RIFOXYD12_FULL_39_22]|nr:MAG: flagellar biosynthetic protein FliP [Bdellovibrionales bacterium RIFOXYB1_FULL_39_21]OFZ42838.1 MAG: flagellar biosynthetic protein FliP [Bdellovibrionales bacterium RIFOXYC12_FULL_39_17]OFZ47502.1 MAG: flagellar biosynthetic protein FliP [Bdellovibrionales bacterium RIFOXYC1_FULL_39_130]OFZ70857.1 MAG: flagellar biosynthetic protein FliP [Bdellovibrionales bacterium RIFOXYC2_FULL_39_8]OFZ75590.1 MAG: flagellar biosynthetic protein FliP [Bdellovibrionales bacterium RIFOXYD1_FULL_39_84]
MKKIDKIIDGRKILLTLIMLMAALPLSAQSTNPNGLNLPGLSVNFGQGVDLVDTIKVLVLFTLLTVAPAIIILTTCFTRIVVVLGFMRQALGTQNLPPNQLLIGLAVFLSIFVMQPTGEAIYQKAILPYLDKKITTTEAIDEITLDMRAFMSKQVRKTDIGLFYDVTGKAAPNTIEEVPIHFLIPAFIISELKTAFQIGFLLYIPFLILDMVVASVLMAMGMMMLPPVVISLPFKLLLFVLVDGWQLVTGSILRSFN